MTRASLAVIVSVYHQMHLGDSLDRRNPSVYILCMLFVYNNNNQVFYNLIRKLGSLDMKPRE
jgi:hypothetical protein